VRILQRGALQVIDPRDYMSTRQVAEAVGVSIARVSQMARSRGIEAQKAPARTASTVEPTSCGSTIADQASWE
jgi:hypothetical protein